MTSPTSRAPAGGAPYIPQIRLYQDWLARERGLRFDNYDALWRWSVNDLEAFWQSIWDYFEVYSPTPHSAALAENRMPGAVWFPGAQVNYAQQVLRHAQAAHAAGLNAIISDNELGEMRELSWPELHRQVASVALALREMGVQRGDRVAAYLPNIPETVVACLACVSIGAVWSVCAPDMGTPAVLDRFGQIEPKVLIAVDGVYYGGRAMDRCAVVAQLCNDLPSVEHLLLMQTSFASKAPIATNSIADCAYWTRATARNDAKTLAFQPESLPFDHPIWVVYSSGTTGLPKPIVHGHGGILMSLMALKNLGNDIGCSYHPNSFGERFHWYSSTGWVMWNAQMAGLATGTTICLYDGNPGGSKDKPDWGVLWRFVARHKVTFFGAGAAYFTNCMKAGLDVSACGDLSRVRALGTTGSPLPEDVQRWGSAQFERVYSVARAGNLRAAGPPQGASTPLGGSDPHAGGERGGDLRAAGSPQGASAPSGGSDPHAVGECGGDIWWCNISGGTDFCGAFIGGNRELPQVPGQMQCRLLGCAVEAWSENGQPVIGEVGELVCTQPIPSMPLYFWGDEGNKRYLSSYFDMYPNVWRHGDWLKVGADSGCVIYGRSDATINRFGLRMGTSEIYSAVEALPEVLDSMVVDLEYLGRDSYMPLFVVLREGVALDGAMRKKINQSIRTALSPRFVPNEIFQVAEIPRTLSGKKQELPVKKLLLGQPVEKVVNRDAMANPACMNWYAALAAQRAVGN